MLSLVFWNIFFFWRLGDLKKITLSEKGQNNHFQKVKNTSDFDDVPDGIGSREGSDLEGHHSHIAGTGLEFFSSLDFRGELNFQ